MPELLLLFGLLFSILWLIIGWRAMRAHETIASEVQKYNETLASGDLSDSKRALTDQKKLYARFLRENPEANDLSSKDRHLKFRDWLEDES